MSLHSHVSYAHGYLQLGMIREAARELARIDQRESDSPLVLKLKLEIDRLKENWKGMRHCGRLLVKFEPDDAQNWISYAYATRRALSLRSARRILLKAHELHPGEPIIPYNLSCYASQLGNLVEASRYLTIALSLSSTCQRLAMDDPDLAPLRAHFEQGLC